MLNMLTRDGTKIAWKNVLAQSNWTTHACPICYAARRVDFFHMFLSYPLTLFPQISFAIVRLVTEDCAHLTWMTFLFHR